MTTLSILWVGALLLLVSIVLTPLSTRIGLPVLLLFLAVGMLAGVDGAGGIRFDDFETAFLVGNLALAVILLDGGMRTRAQTFRVALRPAATLATLGVLITALITGAAAIWLLQLPPLVGLLMGAIVASTDAAAVFALLQGRGLNLNERVSATLEIESGSNDPMAIFLTVLLLQLIALPDPALNLSVAVMLVQQFGLGALAGLAGGWLLTQLVRRLELAPGLYSLLVVAGGILVFSLTGVVGGSGFIAIYLAGLVLGNSGLPTLPNILQVHDGLAWLAQLGLFLILGLLVTPSQMLDQALPALGVALVLIFLARPLAVAACLWPFGFNPREQAYLGWVGLRGAVPIVLALFPIMAQIPEAGLLFNVTFFVVLVSLLIQGTTLAPMARLLRLEVPAPRLPTRRLPLQLPDAPDQELFLLPMRESRFDRPPRVSALKLPAGTHLVCVFRSGEHQVPDSGMQLQGDDWLAIIGSGRHAEALGKLLRATETTAKLDPRQFFGEFVLAGSTRLSDLEQFYGITIPVGETDCTLSQLIARHHRGHPVVGDTVSVGPLRLVVMAVRGDQVQRVGLKLSPRQEA